MSTESTSPPPSPPSSPELEEPATPTAFDFSRPLSPTSSVRGVRDLGLEHDASTSGMLNLDAAALSIKFQDVQKAKTSTINLPSQNAGTHKKENSMPFPIARRNSSASKKSGLGISSEDVLEVNNSEGFGDESTSAATRAGIYGSLGYLNSASSASIRSTATYRVVRRPHVVDLSPLSVPEAIVEDNEDDVVKKKEKRISGKIRSRISKIFAREKGSQDEDLETRVKQYFQNADAVSPETEATKRHKRRTISFFQKTKGAGIPEPLVGSSSRSARSQTLPRPRPIRRPYTDSVVDLEAQKERVRSMSFAAYGVNADDDADSLYEDEDEVQKEARSVQKKIVSNWRYQKFDGAFVDAI